MAPRRPTTTSSKEKEETQGPAPDPASMLALAIEVFDDEFKTLNIWGKIATISGFLGRVPKNGWNKYNSYAYVLESDLVEHVRYWLAAARILIYPTVTDYKVTDRSEGTEKRSGDPRTDVLYTFHVVDGRTGEKFSFAQLGQGSDPRDKGANKASTSAMKFAYLRLFNIASGEDEADADAHGDERAAILQSDRPVTVSAGSTPPGAVQRGGKQATASDTQIKAISNLSNRLNLGAVGLTGVIKRVLEDEVDLGDEEAQHGQILAKYLKTKSGEDAGRLIYTLDEMAKAMPGPEAGYGV